MTKHFLKRDFLDHRLGWAIVLAVTIAWAVAYRTDLLTFGSWHMLLIIYFFFSIAPEKEILGSVWRTQHLMSRHYLLSLPLPHRKLFALQHVRILAFWLPLLLFAGLAPFLAGISQSFTATTWFFYFLGVPITAGLWIEYDIWSTMEWERITSYLPKGARIGAYLKVFAFPLALMFLIFPAWNDLLIPTVYPELAIQLSDSPRYSLSFFLLADLGVPLAQIVFPTSAIVLLFWIRHNARRWCVTL